MSFLSSTISANRTTKICSTNSNIVESDAIGQYDANFTRSLSGLGIANAITLARFLCLGMCRSLKAGLKINVNMTNPLHGNSCEAYAL